MIRCSSIRASKMFSSVAGSFLPVGVINPNFTAAPTNVRLLFKAVTTFSFVYSSILVIYSFFFDVVIPHIHHHVQVVIFDLCST